MKTASSFFFCLLFTNAIAQSVYPNVKIDSQSNNAFEYPPCEPSICVNPADPSVVVGGSVLDAVYLSVDSGKTWTESKMKSPLGVFGDPCIIANRKGDVFYFHLGDPGGKGWSNDHILDMIVGHRSSNKGKTWTAGSGAGSNFPKDQDKEWAVATPDSKKVYLTWTQFDKYESKNLNDSSNILFSWSKTALKKWSKPVRINQYAGDCTDDDGTVEGAVPAVGSKGEVYVAWGLKEKIYFDRSLDNGKTWLDKDIVVSDIVGGWNQEIPGVMRSNGMPILMADEGTRGKLFVCWSDTRNGKDDTDVFVAVSSDKGSTWSSPIRVNNDAPGKHQFFPWMALDQVTGNLYVVFYDRRNYKDNATDVFLATSKDGGITWTNERISESPFTPSASVFFGDYSNISAHNGVVRPIWTRCENGRLSIWTALINK